MPRERWLPAGDPRRTLLVFTLLPLVIASGLLAGCSLVGYTLGSKIDGAGQKLVTVDGWNLERVEVGTQVHALLRTGGEVAGAFEGLDRDSPAAYSARYALWRSQHADLGAPEVGGDLQIVDVGGKPVAATFVAFEVSSLIVIRADNQLVDAIPYRKIDRLSASGGGTWTGTRLADLAHQGRLPLRSCLLMKGEPRVPLDQIERVEMLHAGSTARTVGFIMGAAVDAVLVVAAVHSLNATPTPPPTSSCPYVYSFDGKSYVHEGDAFPGSMFAAAQRTDSLVLSHLDGGRSPLRLRLANELNEVEYVDEVKLLAVDTPPSAIVAPLPAGRLQVLSSPVAPTRAFDLSGKPVLEDGEPWIRSPFAGVAAAGSADGIVLEFPRPPSARSVTLVFRAEPLPWASYLLSRVLALQGTAYPDWYARMNVDAAARAEFMMAFRREGNLILQVWDGGGASWRDEGFVPVHEAVDASLEGIPGDLLRIRLLAVTPGLWKVEGVLADFGTASSAEATEVAAASATASGADVRRLLASTDGRRLVMNHGDSVDLTFVAPSPRPGRDRTFLLKSAGYYSVLVPTEGEPQTALFARLVKEPGALRQFSHEVLSGDVERSLATSSRRAARSGSD